MPALKLRIRCNKRTLSVNVRTSIRHGMRNHACDHIKTHAHARLIAHTHARTAACSPTGPTSRQQARKPEHEH
eukprot:6201912-Pleurochrysis_carterae.AAC.1